MQKISLLLLLFLGITNHGCDSELQASEEFNKEISEMERLRNQGLVNGSLNPFPLVDNPLYASVHEMDYLRDDELVFITKACGLVQVFPHRNLHVEVVNDLTHGTYFAITYCPITRSGIGWNRLIEQDTLLLTASGYLYKENLMPLDLETGSIWSQMLLRGVSGKHSRVEALTFPLIETTWKTVKDYFPGGQVFVNESALKSESVHSQKQDLGIVSREGVELFSLDMFPGEVGIIKTVAQPGGEVMVLGSVDFNYMTAFYTTYEMEVVEGEFPVVLKDETGSYWNLFGEAVSGERGGETLQSPSYYTAAPWAWMDLYEHVTYFD